MENRFLSYLSKAHCSLPTAHCLAFRLSLADEPQRSGPVRRMFPLMPFAEMEFHRCRSGMVVTVSRFFQNEVRQIRRHAAIHSHALPTRYSLPRRSAFDIAVHAIEAEAFLLKAL